MPPTPDGRGSPRARGPRTRGPRPDEPRPGASRPAFGRAPFDGPRPDGSRPGGAGGAAEPRLDGLRVAIVNWRDPWQRAAGGAEEYAWQLGLRLRNLGARVDFVTSRERGQQRRERVQGVRFARMGGKFSRYPMVMGWLLRHRRDFDVVIDCMNGIPFFSPLLVPRRTHVFLLVHHVHCRQFRVYFPDALARLGTALEGPVARRVYRRRPAVAVSVSTAESMRRQLRWTGPIHIVPNGSRPAPRAPASGRARDAGGPVLVCVGRLVATKRVDEVIDAAGRLREQRPGLRLHVVGRGHAEAALADRVSAGDLRGTVRLHGYLPEDDKNALLAGADLHVTASRFEGWGLSVIEAAALGVPTVARDSGGLREAVRDGVTGWLAGPDEDLAPVLDRALKELADPVRRAEVRDACVRWAGRFSWTATGDRMARLILARLAAGDRPRAGGAYVVTYAAADGTGAGRGAVVENTTRRSLTRAAAENGDTIVEIRDASPIELLTGRPGRDL